jgi:hypothetical protein
MTQWGLDTLFNPAKRHMDDEKQRLQSTREEVGDNSGGRRVDLESGKVVIRRAENDDQDEAADDGATTKATTKKADPKKTAAKTTPPSAAAQRAAARRGRTAR